MLNPEISQYMAVAWEAPHGCNMNKGQVVFIYFLTYVIYVLLKYGRKKRRKKNKTRPQLVSMVSSDFQNHKSISRPNSSTYTHKHYKRPHHRHLVLIVSNLPISTFLIRRKCLYFRLVNCISKKNPILQRTTDRQDQWCI